MFSEIIPVLSYIPAIIHLYQVELGAVNLVVSVFTHVFICALNHWAQHCAMSCYNCPITLSHQQCLT